MCVHYNIITCIVYIVFMRSTLLVGMCVHNRSYSDNLMTILMYVLIIIIIMMCGSTSSYLQE